MIDGVTDKAAIAGVQGDRSGPRLPPELALLLFDESSLSLSLRRSNGVLMFFVRGKIVRLLRACKDSK